MQGHSSENNNHPLDYQKNGCLSTQPFHLTNDSPPRFCENLTCSNWLPNQPQPVPVRTNHRGAGVFNGAVETIGNVPKLSTFNPSTSPDEIAQLGEVDAQNSDQLALDVIDSKFEVKGVYICRGISVYLIYNVNI